MQFLLVTPVITQNSARYLEAGHLYLMTSNATFNTAGRSSSEDLDVAKSHMTLYGIVTMVCYLDFAIWFWNDFKMILNDGRLWK